MFELFLVLTKYVLISSSRSNYAITVHYKFPAMLTLLLHYVAAMSFIPSGKWKGLRPLFLKIGRDAAKIRGDMLHLNISCLVSKVMHIHFRVKKLSVLLLLPLAKLNRCF